MTKHSAITRVTRVTLNANNVERLSAFYQECIGLQERRMSASRVTLSADGIHPLLELHQVSNAVKPSTTATGLYHMALLLPNRAALADQLIHLQKSGIRLEGASDHHVSEALYLRDPEGNGIELYADRVGISPDKMGTERLQIQELLKESTGSPWKGLPATTIMGHVHLKASDLKRTAVFYKETLGFELMMELGDSAAFLSTGHYHHHIGLNTWESERGAPPPKNSVGLKHITLQLPDQNAWDILINRLQLQDTHFIKTSEGLVTRDPSGNQIQVVVSDDGAVE